jgi:uncharacterized membrane protein YGL010W
MQNIDELLSEYGESHTNKTNKLIHWICVPLIMLSLVGLIMQIPFPVNFKSLNWAVLVLALALVYYYRLSIPFFIGFMIISVFLIKGNQMLIEFCNSNNWNATLVMILIFVLAWIGQFVGHKIEGKRPSFFEDLQFLLIGPAWLLHFIYKKMGIKYTNSAQ